MTWRYRFTASRFWIRKQTCVFPGWSTVRAPCSSPLLLFWACSWCPCGREGRGGGNDRSGRLFGVQHREYVALGIFGDG